VKIKKRSQPIDAPLPSILCNYWSLLVASCPLSVLDNVYVKLLQLTKLEEGIPPAKFPPKGNPLIFSWICHCGIIFVHEGVFLANA